MPSALHRPPAPLHPVRAAAAATPPHSLHRPFFLAAIVLTLTLGATWGAALLWRIGSGASFSALSIHTVNAHGEAQIYGWVGLFIMGFASQVFPRIWRSPPISRPLCLTALGTTIAGIVLRAAGLELVGSSEWSQTLAIGGGALNVLGVSIFSMQMLNAFERRRVPVEPAFLYMIVAIGWLVLSTVFSLVHTWLTLRAGSRDELIEIVGTYQAALRDVQIHGAALTMILGVSLKMLPAMFGVAPVSHRRSMLALALVTIAVATETSFFIAFRLTESRPFAGIVYLAWMMLAAGVGTILIRWTPCLGLPRDDGRSGKFVRAAYVWLAISLLMLLFMPFYSLLAATPFSHAYYGATRHAITVGFISLMIMGIGGKVVPALHGISRFKLGGLWGPFILVNLGCTLRVTLQTTTDFVPGAFAIVGVSGLLEVAGLGWWGLEMARHMLRRRASSTVVPLTINDPEATPDDDDAAAPDDAPPRPCCSACAAERSKAGMG